MTVRWNNSGSINWSHLDRRLIDSWTRKAERAHGVERFVFSFIVVNHYYSAWAVASGQHFKVERQEAMHLATLPVLAGWWPEFVKLHNVKGRKIPLPLQNRHGKPVPQAVPAREYEAAQLALDQYLNVVYQLRCDFFHAGRATVGFHNERAVRFVDDPILELVRFLGMHTTPK